MESLLRQLEPVIDNASSGQTLKTELSQGACAKEVYKRGDYRIIIFKKGQNGVVSGSVTPATNSLDPSTLNTCLRKTENFIGKNHFQEGADIFRAYRTKFPDIWSDGDIGAPKWLDCKDMASISYYNSIPVLLHELTHDLRQQQCLYTPQENLCFELSPKLPLRSVAAFKSFPFKDENTIKGLSFIQNTYMTVSDQPPLILFDELNAYIVTNKTMTHILEKEGASALFDGEKRSGVFLPMFLLYTVRYLTYVKNNEPELYKINFESHERNKAALKILWNNGENTYTKWKSLLKKLGHEEKPFESTYWHDYLQEKKNLHLF